MIVCTTPLPLSLILHLGGCLSLIALSTSIRSLWNIINNNNEPLAGVECEPCWRLQHHQQQQPASTSTCSSSHCINILEHVYLMETRAAYLRVRSKSLEINARISRFNAYYVERTSLSSLSSLLLSMLLLLLLFVFVLLPLPLPWLPSLLLSSIHNWDILGNTLASAAPISPFTK